MAPTVGFRPNAEDERIIDRALKDGETTTDVIRRALRLLDREQRRQQMWHDMTRIAASDENLSDEPDAW